MARTLKQMLGKQVLASLTELDANGRIIRRQEFHGTLVEKQGKPVCLRHDNNSPFSLPENLSYYCPVDPSTEYQLQETGEKITGIDYALTFVKAPEEFFRAPP